MCNLTDGSSVAYEIWNNVVSSSYPAEISRHLVDVPDPVPTRRTQLNYWWYTTRSERIRSSRRDLGWFTAYYYCWGYYWDYCGWFVLVEEHRMIRSQLCGCIFHKKFKDSSCGEAWCWWVVVLRALRCCITGGRRLTSALRRHLWWASVRPWPKTQTGNVLFPIQLLTSDALGGLVTSIMGRSGERPWRSRQVTRSALDLGYTRITLTCSP